MRSQYRCRFATTSSTSTSKPVPTLLSSSNKPGYCFREAVYSEYHNHKKLAQTGARELTYSPPPLDYQLKSLIGQAMESHASHCESHRRPWWRRCTTGARIGRRGTSGGSVEQVPARRQPPHRLAGAHVLQAHRAERARKPAALVRERRQRAESHRVPEPARDDLAQRQPRATARPSSRTPHDPAGKHEQGNDRADADDDVGLRDAADHLGVGDHGQEPDRTGSSAT
jgi:hypothetical protein